MEGPTPVSSLLHSCTLVMAGIFVLINSTARFNLGFGFLALLSLAFIVLTARVEKDVKRTVAASTVVMVGFVWALLSTSLTHAAVIIAFIHASYKSALFLLVGKLLGHISLYSDNGSSSSQTKSALGLAFIFLAAPRTSPYASSKHSTDSLVFSRDLDLALMLLVSLGGLLI
jgi:NADH:ubiquinone oxidoreductase subunit 5 (subunit L)/multisubunit Na+/H+ antiporter MnhA subunit